MTLLTEGVLMNDYPPPQADGFGAARRLCASPAHLL